MQKGRRKTNSRLDIPLNIFFKVTNLRIVNSGVYFKSSLIFPQKCFKNLSNIGRFQVSPVGGLPPGINADSDCEINASGRAFLHSSADLLQSTHITAAVDAGKFTPPTSFALLLLLFH